MIHFGKKEFRCLVCLKKFARKDVLNQHMVTHTKKKEL